MSEPALGLDPGDTNRSRPVAVVLRPGKTPSGVEVRGHLRRLVRCIRVRSPKARILFRGDNHYARPEAMEWCKANGIDFVFGLAGRQVVRQQPPAATGPKEIEDGVHELRVAALRGRPPGSACGINGSISDH